MSRQPYEKSIKFISAKELKDMDMPPIVERRKGERRKDFFNRLTVQTKGHFARRVDNSLDRQFGKRPRKKLTSDFNDL